MKKLRHVLVVGLLVMVPVTLMASSCAPLSSQQIAEANGNPLALAETSFLQWYFNNVIAPILKAVLPMD